MDKKGGGGVGVTSCTLAHAGREGMGDAFLCQLY